LVGRASLEREVAQGEYTARENEPIRRNLLGWIKQSGLNPELEAEEHRFLATSVGRASERDLIDAEWRSEGLAVLMWALQRFELPQYDQGSTEDLAAERIGFLSSVSEADRSQPPLLRPSREINRFQSHITIVSWRLTQFRLSREHPLYQVALSGLGTGRTGVGEGMDFVGYLRAHPSFKGYWLDGLKVVEGDLAIGDSSIAKASREDVKKRTSIVTERQIASYWLLGDDEIYSKVNAATLLSAC
jgi:hypothetical protein